jgi:hypothetical protein
VADATGLRRPGGAGAAAYSVVLPPQWAQIPLRNGTDDAIANVLDNAFARLPRELPRDRVTPYRRELGRRLGQLAGQARRSGGLCLYLPVEPMHGTPIAASFVISAGSLGSGDVDPGLIASQLAAGQEGATPAMVDGAAAVRIERTAPPDPEREIEFGSRRVDYVIPVPGQPGQWLIAAFSTLGSGDPDGEHARLLTGLFDAIMSTFSWAGV